jgi:hypothetical protein
LPDPLTNGSVDDDDRPKLLPPGLLWLLFLRPGWVLGGNASALLLGLGFLPSSLLGSSTYLEVSAVVAGGPLCLMQSHCGLYPLGPLFFFYSGFFSYANDILH